MLSTLLAKWLNMERGCCFSLLESYAFVGLYLVEWVLKCYFSAMDFYGCLQAFGNVGKQIVLHFKMKLYNNKDMLIRGITTTFLIGFCYFVYRSKLTGFLKVFYFKEIVIIDETDLTSTLNLLTFLAYSWEMKFCPSAVWTAFALWRIIPELNSTERRWTSKGSVRSYWWVLCVKGSFWCVGH